MLSDQENEREKNRKIGERTRFMDVRFSALFGYILSAIRNEYACADSAPKLTGIQRTIRKSRRGQFRMEM